MKKAVIEIDDKQLLSALEQLPPENLKKIIDALFFKRLFIKPTFGEVSAKTKKIIKKQNLGKEVVEEAIEWARKSK